MINLINLVKTLVLITLISAVAIGVHKRKLAAKAKLKMVILDTNFEEEPFVKIQVLGQTAINVRPNQTTVLELPDNHTLHVKYENTMQLGGNIENGAELSILTLKHGSQQVRIFIDWIARKTVKEDVSDTPKA